jgi:hypothetical protein
VALTAFGTLLAGLGPLADTASGAVAPFTSARLADQAPEGCRGGGLERWRWARRVAAAEVKAAEAGDDPAADRVGPAQGPGGRHPRLLRARQLDAATARRRLPPDAALAGPAGGLPVQPPAAPRARSASPLARQAAAAAEEQDPTARTTTRSRPPRPPAGGDRRRARRQRTRSIACPWPIWWPVPAWHRHGAPGIDFRDGARWRQEAERL